jgi:hypothetical protein
MKRWLRAAGRHVAKWLSNRNLNKTSDLMALTRDFKETVMTRAERDLEFREALLTEAIEQLIDGQVDVGKAVLREYIAATISRRAD